MAYSNNPNLPKARVVAMQLLIKEQLPLLVVANKCGVHRSTVYRWKRKWSELNKHVQLTNDNRSNRIQPSPSSTFRLAACIWRIPTLTTRSGELVQTDTIHHLDPRTGRRLYCYTVIDLFTRMTHVTLAPKLRQGLAVQAILQAQAVWGFPIVMVQADNGPEYQRYFEQQMKRINITTRHSRLHRPNDNAHIERFNRTVQTECIGYYWNRSVSIPFQQVKLTAWLAYYNTRRVHLGIQLLTPIQMLQGS